MPHIIHINDKVRSAGGVEVYLSHLQHILNSDGFHSSWISLQREGSTVRMIDAERPAEEFFSHVDEFSEYLTDREEPPIYHVHSLSDPVLMSTLFATGKVIRTMHEPRLFCPGQGKFWRTDEAVCSLPCGLHCAWHAYQKKCSNRHPKRLFAALRNTQYEITTAAKQYSYIIANSHWVASQGIEAGLPEQKIRIIPYFTPIIEPSPLSQCKPPRILFVGRLTREKGLHYLIDALSKIHTSLDAVHLDIVGDGHERAVFEDKVEQLGIRERCTFYGWLDRQQINERFDASTVVAFPSIYPEAFGIVGIEAMMRSRPVVAFNTGGVSDWLKHDVNGILVPLKDTPKLSSALHTLCTQPDYAAALGKAGRAIALSHFTSKHHLSALTNLYRQAALEK